MDLRTKLEGDTDYNLNIDKGILIEKKKLIEIDGFYEINELKFPLFNPEEVIIIYNSVENDLNEFKYIIIKIKMNQKKINELISQIIKRWSIFREKYDSLFGLEINI